MTQGEQALKLSLTKAIREWADKEAELDENWPEVYYYELQSEDMANAAFSVFLASVRGQRYYKENE
jgi:hypothetical protein